MELIARLQTLLGEKAVITDPAELLPYQTDWRGLYKNPALCAVLPETTEHVAAAIKLCAEAGSRIVPQGGNTGLVAGGVPAEGRSQVVLSLRRMNKILAFEEDHATVQAGVVLQTLQEAAAARGKLFPVSLGAEGTAQIGGLISTNAGGVNVLAYGSMRAQVLGLEVVLADGRIWDGLRALHKDNTGYDLKQLFIGAEGTLGVVTAACLKLHPAVTARATSLVGVKTVHGAVAMFRHLRIQASQSLTLCEFIDGPAMQLAVRHAPGVKLPFEAPHYVLAEFSGADTAALGRDMEAVLEFALADEFAIDAVIAQSDRERQAFLALREAVPEGELREGGALKHDIAVPIGRIPATVAAIETLMEKQYPACRLNIFGHLGDGNLHVNVRPPTGQSVADLASVKTAITAGIEDIAVEQGGSFSAEHGIGQMRLPGMLAHKAPVELDMMRAVKAAFDPAGLFNPGKLLP
jgi:FAD/FMN-containing dehydrogenase